MTSIDSVELLVVEDNPNDLELTLRALKKNKIENHIHVVKDGAEALDYLFCRGSYSRRSVHPTPKVIFLDLKLPKVDGMEVLRQIKSESQTRPIPVVMLTSSQQERDVLESYQLGVNSYVVKPIDFSKFADVIGQLVRYWLFLNHPPH